MNPAFRPRLVPGMYRAGFLPYEIPACVQRAPVVPRFEGVPAPDVKLVWPAQAATNYRVEFSNDLLEWQPRGATVQVGDGEVSTVDPAAAIGPRKFHRLARETR